MKDWTYEEWQIYYEGCPEGYDPWDNPRDPEEGR